MSDKNPFPTITKELTPEALKQVVLAGVAFIVMALLAISASFGIFINQHQDLKDRVEELEVMLDDSYQNQSSPDFAPPNSGTAPGFPGDEGVACTMDAKICPDGSSVGRVPPSCEFAECSDSSNTQ